MNILALNLVLNIFIYSVAARIYLLPHLPRLESRTVLVPILLLHATRHLGMMFVARIDDPNGVVDVVEIGNQVVEASVRMLDLAGYLRPLVEQS